MPLPPLPLPLPQKCYFFLVAIPPTKAEAAALADRFRFCFRIPARELDDVFRLRRFSRRLNHNAMIRSSVSMIIQSFQTTRDWRYSKWRWRLGSGGEEWRSRVMGDKANAMGRD